MSQTLQETATVQFEKGIATSCQRDGCNETETLRMWIENDDYGRDRITVFCSSCSENVAEVQPRYSYVGEILNEGDDNETVDVPYLDRYDKPVIAGFQVGERVSVKTITNRYLTQTNISNKDTAKERKNSLVKTPAFENDGIGVFRFVGVDSDE